MNPYDVLGVSVNASRREVRRAFQSLAKRYHPDRNKSVDAADRFREVMWAWRILGEPGHRVIFDRYGIHGMPALEIDDGSERIIRMLMGAAR